MSEPDKSLYCSVCQCATSCEDALQAHLKGNVFLFVIRLGMLKDNNCWNIINVRSSVQCSGLEFAGFPLSWTNKNVSGKVTSQSAFPKEK